MHVCNIRYLLTNCKSHVLCVFLSSFLFSASPLTPALAYCRTLCMIRTRWDTGKMGAVGCCVGCWA